MYMVFYRTGSEETWCRDLVTQNRVWALRRHAKRVKMYGRDAVLLVESVDVLPLVVGAICDGEL